jgi:hypothetical protein
MGIKKASEIKASPSTQPPLTPGILAETNESFSHYKIITTTG